MIRGWRQGRLRVAMAVKDGDNEDGKAKKRRITK
jgi:hypothetical protein